MNVMTGFLLLAMALRMAVVVPWVAPETVTTAVTVRATSDFPDVTVSAVQFAGGGTVTLSNRTARTLPVSIDAGERPAHSYQLTDATRKGKYFDDAPSQLPPQATAVVHYDWRTARWARPQTTRRYLQGPFAERLLVQWREGRVTLGEVVHRPDWKSCPYERQIAHGLWLLRGEREDALDFRAAKLRLDDDAAPIAGATWEIGDLTIDVEGCAPFGRRPNAHVRVTLTNRGGASVDERLAFLLRTGREKALCAGAPDGYFSYDPQPSAWFALPSAWTMDADGVCRDGDRFAAFSRPTEGDFILPRQGGLQRWVWPGDQKQASAALDRLGYGDYVEKTVSYYFDCCQQASGEVGPFGNGWINDTASCLDVLANHALTGSADESSAGVAFWRHYRDAGTKAFRWIDALRAADGLFPAKKSTDAGLAMRHWGATDLCNLSAIEKFAAAAQKFGDPIAAEAAAVAADYRAAIGRGIDRWRAQYAGKDEFYLPFSPDGDNDRFYQKNFYFSHPGNFAGAGFLTEEEMLRLRTWLLRRGYASERGPYELCRSARPDIACHVWYLTWSELGWFTGWRRVGRNDLAQAALDTCLKYAMTAEYLVGERYHDCDPWYFPWCPNASGAGRILQMLLSTATTLL